MTDLKILVVDDDPVTLLLIKKKIISADYEVETATNGEEAVDLISGNYYDVVLTDLMMPGDIDGIGVLEATKKLYRQTEVILITAYASVDNAVEAMQKGASDYIQKPINFDELLLRLDKIRGLKALIKDAVDLREAMDVTEKNAGHTIQDLELEISHLQKRISEIKKVLSMEDRDHPKRINIALAMLSAIENNLS